MKFSIPMLKAFLLLSILMLMMTAMQYISLETSTFFKISFFAMTIANAAFIIKALDILCRKKFTIGDEELDITNFTTWGYLWRGYLSLYALLPIWMLVNLIVPLNPPDTYAYTTTSLIVYEPVFLVCLIVAIWVFFSNNRVDQLKQLFKIVRGY